LIGSVIPFTGGCMACLSYVAVSLMRIGECWLVRKASSPSSLTFAEESLTRK
jgi:hypothetical protein